MLSCLIGKKFNRISRAADMLCLFLGEDYVYRSPVGRSAEVAEFSIHFTTQWRFRLGGEILLASRDIYTPYSNGVPEDWAYDIVGRPDELSSVFDVAAKQIMQKMSGSVVSECRLSETNDITIVFSNGVVFEQFTPASRKGEEWRLIDYVGGRHIVCYDVDGLISVE